VVGRQVAVVRKGRGMSVLQLAKAVSDTGVKMDRFAVSNLERGDRKSIGVHELFALAEVLDVAPIHLLVPIEGGDYMVTPKHQVDSARARAWIRGQSPFLETPDEGDERDPGRDEWMRFLSWMPSDERRELLGELSGRVFVGDSADEVDKLLTAALRRVVDLDQAAKLEAE
jgi:transcriptional regulator with XRE-family HTH domain